MFQLFGEIIWIRGYYGLVWIIIYYWLSLIIIDFYGLLWIIVYGLLWIVIDYYGLSLWIILDNIEIRYPNGLLIPAPQYETVPPNSKHLEGFLVLGGIQY